MAKTSQFKKFSCSATDGLMLGGRLYGEDNQDQTPVVCLAGLSRNCLDFHNLAVHFSSKEGGERKVLAIDYRGRGYSQYDKNWQNYTIFQEAEDTIAAITASGFKHLDIIGTSRGGLIAMLLGSMRPGILNSVILNDIGPVLEGQGLLRIRNSLEKRKKPKTWQEAEEEFVRVGKLQFPMLTEAQWQEEAHRVFEEKDGKIIPRYDKKLVNTLMSINFDVRLPDMWAQFASLTNIPVMTLRGEHSDLLSKETLEMMQALHPNMKVEIVSGQGHAPRLGTAGLPEKITSFFGKVKATKKGP